MSLLRQAERALTNQRIYEALNAFLPAPEGAELVKRAAQSADDRKSSGVSKSVIDGMLVSVKDNICTTEQGTTCASGLLDGYASPYSAAVIEKLQTAGAIIVGKTNMDEFGMGSHSANSIFGPVSNPYGSVDFPLSAGGSSGGSAVAVASGQCNVALGTDTGGSVRLPAAYTGTVGFKPSYGIVSRWGVVAYANSLDTIGILARNSTTVKGVFDVLKGYDSRDPTSLSPGARAKIADMWTSRKSTSRIRFGVPVEYNITELEPTLRQAWKTSLESLEKLGHSVQPISLPSTKLALSAYYVIAPAEASSNLAKYDGVRYGNQTCKEKDTGNALFAGTRGDGFSQEVKRRILLGAFSLSAAAIDNYFLKAQRVRRLVQQDFNNVFSLPHPLLKPSSARVNKAGVDILISPTAPATAPTLANVHLRDAIDKYSDDVLTVPASLAGIPAISIPFVFLPGVQATACVTTGIQLTAQYGDDDFLLETAQTLEQKLSELSSTDGLVFNI